MQKRQKLLNSENPLNAVKKSDLGILTYFIYFLLSRPAQSE